MKKIFELNENGIITYQNVQYAVKEVLREEFIALNTYIREE